MTSNLSFWMRSVTARPQSVDALTREKGIELVDTGFVGRLQEFVPKIGASEELLDGAFALTKENPWPKQVFEVNGKRVAR